jgi:hypothetical protein
VIAAWRGPQRIPAPTGQSIPAQGNALGIKSRTFPHCNGTPQVVASPSRARAVTRARTMRRSFRAHAYPPSHTPHACPRSVSQGCTLGWYALTLWIKPRLARSQSNALGIMSHTFPHAYPPSHTPHACPRSVSQGCTLGWHALTLWVKPRLGLSRGGGGDGGGAGNGGMGGRDMGPDASVMVRYRRLSPVVAEDGAEFRSGPGRAANGEPCRVEEILRRAAPLL